MGAPHVADSGFESVTAYLGWYHDRLDRALRVVSAAVEKREFAKAAARFQEFDKDLLRHVRVEEELLFPVFEARSGIVNGPTAVLRDEHRQVRRALELMRRGIETGDAGGYGDGLRFFETVLPDHIAKEEHILFPTLDMLLRPSERAALVERLNREGLR